MTILHRGGRIEDDKLAAVETGEDLSLTAVILTDADDAETRHTVNTYKDIIHLSARDQGRVGDAESGPLCPRQKGATELPGAKSFILREIEFHKKGAAPDVG